ncbi:MAG: hypothetical protein M0023_01600 [Desulfobacteraceae bacterium]|nr:hypothetical protein [Desulfobacteraceae bacterium]
MKPFLTYRIFILGMVCAIFGAFTLFLVIGGMVSLLFRYYIIPILRMSESSRCSPTSTTSSRGGSNVLYGFLPGCSLLQRPTTAQISPAS